MLPLDPGSGLVRFFESSNGSPLEGTPTSTFEDAGVLPGPDDPSHGPGARRTEVTFGYPIGTLPIRLLGLIGLAIPLLASNLAAAAPGDGGPVGYEVWAADQSNTVAGVPLGTLGSRIWVWDSRDIEAQVETGIAATPLGCDGGGSGRKRIPCCSHSNSRSRKTMQKNGRGAVRLASIGNTSHRNYRTSRQARSTRLLHHEAQCYQLKQFCEQSPGRPEAWR